LVSGAVAPGSACPGDCPSVHRERLHLVPVCPADDHVRLQNPRVVSLVPRPDPLQRLDPLGAQRESWFTGQLQPHPVRLDDTLRKSQPYCCLMRDPCHTHVLTPGGPEPDQLSVPANYREAPRSYLLLRLGPLTPAASAPSVGLIGPPVGSAPEISARSTDLPLRSLLPTSAAPGRGCLWLRRQPQQMMPPKPDPTVAPRARQSVSAIREATFSAIPFLKRLPPLGDRQAFFRSPQSPPGVVRTV
jgi:hypothetical protein